ncbi:MAG: stage III sporulation protein AE [Eubacterium sp.]|nr:stage III sporulation protein AE [Eubacterium sp.]
MFCLIHIAFPSSAASQPLQDQTALESILNETTQDDTTVIIEGEINTDEIQSSGEELYEESIDELLDSLDFSELDDFLESVETESPMSFGELVKTLIAENGQVDKKWFFSQIWSLLASELQESRPIFVQILIMCVAFAMLNNFAMVFKNSQIQKSCFFIFYLALITLLMKSYLVSSQLLVEVMDSLIGFMQALIPAFCMALSFTTAVSSAAVFYQIIIVVIYLIERILVYVIIPAIHIYVVLMMLNLLSEERLISGITDLLKKGITWVLRLMIGGITGINILQI